MIRFLKNYPLFRENILQIQDFDVSQVKEYLDKARRLLAKLTQITDF